MRLRTLAVFVPLAAALALEPAAAQDRAGDSVPMPDGIATADGRVGFIEAAAGGIEAIDLDTGKTLWASAETRKPLAVLADGGVAAEETVALVPTALRIVFFDAKGARRLATEPIDIGEPVAGLVRPGEMQREGTSFSSAGRVERGALFVSWEAHTRVGWHSGVPPSKEQMEAMARQARDAKGCVRVEIATGKFEKLAAAPAALRPKLPASVAELFAAKPMEFDEFVKKGKRVSYARVSYAPSSEPFVVGSTVAALEKTETIEKPNVREKLVLRRWDLATGAEKGSTDIAEDFVYDTTDGRHIIALVTKPGAKRVVGVYSLESGKRVGAIVGKIFDAHPYDTFWPGTVVHVHGSRALIGDLRNHLGEKEAFLEAFDLEKGESLWKHALRPPPPPPGPQPPSAPRRAE